MRQLKPDDPRHVKLRSAMRVAGPVILLLGVALTGIAAASLVGSFGSYEPPRFFWLGFVGLPLIFVGSVLSMYGFMGAMLRYHANEAAPVMSETVNYTAGQTRPGIRAAASAFAEGIREGISQVRSITCPRCQRSNDSDAHFCKACGAALKE